MKELTTGKVRTVICYRRRTPTIPNMAIHLRRNHPILSLSLYLLSTTPTTTSSVQNTQPHTCIPPFYSGSQDFTNAPPHLPLRLRCTPQLQLHPPLLHNTLQNGLLNPDGRYHAREGTYLFTFLPSYLGGNFLQKR